MIIIKEIQKLLQSYIYAEFHTSSVGQQMMLTYKYRLKDNHAKSRPRGIAGLGIRSWVCSDCGASHDRDVNAAKNILRIGLSAQPLVEESRVS
jgi:transposase